MNNTTKEFIETELQAANFIEFNYIIVDDVLDTLPDDEVVGVVLNTDWVTEYFGESDGWLPCYTETVFCVVPKEGVKCLGSELLNYVEYVTVADAKEICKLVLQAYKDYNEMVKARGYLQRPDFYSFEDPTDVDDRDTGYDEDGVIYPNTCVFEDPSDEWEDDPLPF